MRIMSPWITTQGGCVVFFSMALPMHAALCDNGNMVAILARVRYISENRIVICNKARYMENGGKITDKKFDLESDLINITPLVLLICAAVAVFYYVDVFGWQFSKNQSDWSAFGSYIGGIFGPLVSFITLLAVLKTVALQRELLATQRSEFKAMQALQQNTFDAQQSQINEAAIKSYVDGIERFREFGLQMVDRHILLFENKLDRAEANIGRYNEVVSINRIGLKPGLMSEALKQKETSAKMIERLVALSVAISQDEFLTIESIQDFYRNGMSKVFSNELAEFESC
ncbi:hypothetical protein [Pseudomonas sp. RIT-PI-q]|uniref:hypothetical protein n=1 Tax=Pseudomonas sp. RIT-PI-q TaxID=1690247 RepID=UPI00128EE1AF|nr:hypothetical protein [Pseudomonas sp. RIT-PI-q]